MTESNNTEQRTDKGRSGSTGLLASIPVRPQRQDSAMDQIADLVQVANRLGMHDAADAIYWQICKRLTNKLCGLRIEATGLAKMTDLFETTEPEGGTGVASPNERLVMPDVLDACCGTRMFWFNKNDDRALFVDKREGVRIIDVGTQGTKGRSPKVVAPDKICDFRNMPFKDESFYHVVFDPPHFRKGAGKTGRIAFDYGLLDETWRDDIRKGFSECFRLLKPKGTLIFKWCEAEIPLKEVLALTDERPLYGHRSGKKAQTHWVAFLKA